MAKNSKSKGRTVNRNTRDVYSSDGRSNNRSKRKKKTTTKRMVWRSPAKARNPARRKSLMKARNPARWKSPMKPRSPRNLKTPASLRNTTERMEPQATRRDDAACLSVYPNKSPYNRHRTQGSERLREAVLRPLFSKS